MGTVGVCNIVRYSTQQITSLRLVSQSERLLYGVIIHLSVAENLALSEFTKPPSTPSSSSPTLTLSLFTSHLQSSCPSSLPAIPVARLPVERLVVSLTGSVGRHSAKLGSAEQLRSQQPARFLLHFRYQHHASPIIHPQSFQHSTQTICQCRHNNQE